MENELTSTQPEPGKPLQRLANIRPSFSQFGIIFGLAAVLALGVGTVMWSLEPNYTPLFSHLAEQDTALIADTLRASNIPYRIDDRTGLVLVPADKLQDVRIRLAAEGLPQGTAAGFELLQQDQGLGTSQFIETARYQHALETELSRSISAMRNIESARVHLAMPKQSVFVRKRVKSSASVMVKLFPGRTLDKGQVDSIVHLVAASVPHLEASQVTVVDQWGRLLTGGDMPNDIALTTKQFEYTRKLERSYARRIENLLTPILGADRVRAEVNAELDFSRNESTQESFGSDATHLRSEQVQDQEGRGPLGAVGIPGALSNQPPGAGTTNPAEAQSDQPQEVTPTNKSRSATRNYELDKTITHTRHTPVAINRLSVAVIADDRVTVNEQGESVRTPLSEEDIALITGLVKEAIGFNEQRGDTVAVYNRSFLPPQTVAPIPDAPIWEQPWVWTLGKQLLAALIVLLILLLVVRPAMRALSAKHVASLPAPGSSTTESDVADDRLMLSGSGTAAQLTGPQSYEEQINTARAMAAEDPKRVAKVVKTWVNEDV